MTYSLYQLTFQIKEAWSSPARRAEQSARKKGRPIGHEQRAKISASLIGHPGYGKGQKRPEMSAWLSGRIWITDGTTCKRVLANAPVPNGWHRGKVHKKKTAAAMLADAR